MLKRAAAEAIDADINQYAITWGAKPFRDAIAAKYLRTYGMEFDPEREITVCCGATEGMIASLLAVLDPGDEVVLFEPFYENYGPDTQLCGAYSALRDAAGARTGRFDPDELRARLHSPHQSHYPQLAQQPHREGVLPRGTGAHRRPLPGVRCLAITDEIYEHILYDGAVHVPIMSLPGMRERSILVNSMSKTYSVTGWRVGWVLAPPDLTDSIRKVHDFLTVGAAAPLQQAGRHGALAAGRVLHASRHRICGAARPHREGPGKARFHVFYPARGVLCDDRHLRLWFAGRYVLLFGI